MLIAFLLALLATFTGTGSTHANAVRTSIVHTDAATKAPAPNSAHALAG